MSEDRILQPEDVANLIRACLEEQLHPFEAAYRAMRLAGSGDRILAGHQTRVVIAAYWALRRLAETGPYHTSEDDLRYLLDCLEGRRRFPPPS